MTDLDNIPGGDLFEPGNVPMRTDQNGYINRDDLLDALAEELNGRPFYTTQADRDAATRIAEMEENGSELRRAIEDRQARGSQMTDPDDWFDPPDESGEIDYLARSEEASRGVRDYAARNDNPINDADIYEAAGYLADRGGSFSDAILDATLARSFDDVGPQQRSPRSTDRAPEGQAGSGQSGGDTPAEAEGGARDEGNRGRQSEQTPEGEQTLIDGVVPVTDLDRLQARQNAPLRGGDAEADIGLFDTNSRAQADMFDEPTSPGSQARMDTHQKELSEAFEDFADIEVEMDDEAVTARKILNDLDRDQDHIAALEACSFLRSVG